VLPSITAGMAKITMNDCTSSDQTYSGSRSRVSPGAFCLKMVTMRFTATTSAEISVKVTSCAQRSDRLPGAKVLASGT
jgi:hypothetical protein